MRRLRGHGLLALIAFRWHLTASFLHQHHHASTLYYSRHTYSCDDETFFRKERYSLISMSSSPGKDSSTTTFDSSEATPRSSLGRPCAIHNFRPAAGLSSRIYRCASTDGLADVVTAGGTTITLHEAERKVLYETGLVLDLRSPSERDGGRAAKWGAQAKFVTRDAAVVSSAGISDDPGEMSDSSSTVKQIVRIDILSPQRFFRYADENFLTPTQKALSKLYMIAQADKAHELRIEALNERGLSGLNEVILETGGKELCLGLQEITLQLERDSALDVVVHCVQGKDRTGMLVMLCQAVVGLGDEEIIADYHKSNQMTFGSAAADDVAMPPRRRRRGKLDRTVFSGAPVQAMVDTLHMLRSQYGSIDEYLDRIGFGMGWRDRFRRQIGSDSRSRL